MNIKSSPKFFQAHSPPHPPHTTCCRAALRGGANSAEHVRCTGNIVGDASVMDVRVDALGHAGCHEGRRGSQSDGCSLGVESLR